MQGPQSLQSHQRTAQLMTQKLSFPQVLKADQIRHSLVQKDFQNLRSMVVRNHLRSQIRRDLECLQTLQNCLQEEQQRVQTQMRPTGISLLGYETFALHSLDIFQAACQLQKSYLGSSVDRRRKACRAESDPGNFAVLRRSSR